MLVTIALEAVFYPLARSVADAGGMVVVFLLAGRSEPLVDCCSLLGFWPWLRSWPPFLPGFGSGFAACGLCATQKHYMAYRRFCFPLRPATFVLLGVSCSLAALPSVLVPPAATCLESRRFTVCRRAAPLASMTDCTVWQVCTRVHQGRVFYKSRTFFPTSG